MLLLLIKDVKVVKLNLFSQLDLYKNPYLYFCIMRALRLEKGRYKLGKITTEGAIVSYYGMKMK